MTPDNLVGFVQDALADFPLTSGYCGYSFVWDESSVDGEAEANKWAGPLLLLTSWPQLRKPRGALERGKRRGRCRCELAHLPWPSDN